MIQKLSIRNFKSVRELDLSCRRVNVFIGEPNAGKTNILEALAFCGSDISYETLRTLRTTNPTDVFWDQNPGAPLTINLDNDTRSIERSNDVWFVTDLRHGELLYADSLNANHFSMKKGHKLRELAAYYVFGTPDSLWQEEAKSDALCPPDGRNMAALLYANKDARSSSSQFFANSGFRLMVDYSAKGLKLAKEKDDVLVALPYQASSETLRRMVFFHLAIDSNKERLLAFDEPEAHAYPPYTKILAEKMAKDDRGNQFFLTTHSPYMLTSLIEKTPVDELNVVLCRMENFETKAYVMNEEQKGQLLEWGMSAFYNFDRLVDDES